MQQSKITYNKDKSLYDNRLFFIAHNLYLKVDEMCRELEQTDSFSLFEFGKEIDKLDLSQSKKLDWVKLFCRKFHAVICEIHLNGGVWSRRFANSYLISLLSDLYKGLSVLFTDDDANIPYDGRVYPEIEKHRQNKIA